MAAGIYNFTIEQGSTVDFEIQYKDSAGTPIDLSGYTANMVLRTEVGGESLGSLTSSLGNTYTKTSGSAFLSLSGSNLTTPLTSGSIGVYIGYTKTDAYTFGTAVYDIELTNVHTRTRLIQGKVKLSKDIS